MRRSNISIVIAEAEILNDLELTLKNHFAGNFEKWGLKPVLPETQTGDTYQQAAVRFLKNSDWISRVEQIVPKIEAWWDNDGSRFASLMAQKLGISQPKVFIIFPVPFGPGGSYNLNNNGIYVRIREFDNNEWWQHVIVHELTHILASNIEVVDHVENEIRVNGIIKEVLNDLGLDYLATI